MARDLVEAILKESLARHNMAFENNRLEGLGAASTFDLQSLLIGIFDSPEDLVRLLRILQLLLNLLYLGRLEHLLLGAFSQLFFGSQEFLVELDILSLFILDNFLKVEILFLGLL